MLLTIRKNEISPVIKKQKQIWLISFHQKCNFIFYSTNKSLNVRINDIFVASIFSFLHIGHTVYTMERNQIKKTHAFLCRLNWFHLSSLREVTQLQNSYLPSLSLILPFLSVAGTGFVLKSWQNDGVWRQVHRLQKDVFFNLLSCIYT